MDKISRETSRMRLLKSEGVDAKANDIIARIYKRKQIKIFTGLDVADIEARINKFLTENVTRIEYIDLKFNAMELNHMNPSKFHAIAILIYKEL